MPPSVHHIVLNTYQLSALNFYSFNACQFVLFLAQNCSSLNILADSPADLSGPQSTDDFAKWVTNLSFDIKTL